jgi:SdrD B-like domain
MRVSMLVVALIATPLFASVSQAQGKSDAAHANNRYKVCEMLSKKNAHADKANANSDHRVPMKCTNKPGDPPSATGNVSIYGMAFTDVNGNGYFDGGDIALVGQVVQLSGPVSATATSMADGSYSFTSLPVGSYTVCAAAGKTQSAPTDGPACGSGAPGYSLDALTTDDGFINIDFALQ